MKMNRFPARKESPVLDTARMRSWLARRRYNVQDTKTFAGHNAQCQEKVQYTIYKDSAGHTVYNVHGIPFSKTFTLTFFASYDKK